MGEKMFQCFEVEIPLDTFLAHGNEIEEGIIQGMLKAMAEENLNHSPTTTQTKENTMFHNLISLAVDQEDAELHGNLAPAVQRALEAQQAKAQEAAAVELLDILDRVKHHKTTVKREVKRLRREADRRAKSLDRVDRANAYGQSTGNFIPLMIELGLVSSHRSINGLDREDFETLSKIPSDWTPGVATNVNTQGEANTEVPPAE